MNLELRAVIKRKIFSKADELDIRDYFKETLKAFVDALLDYIEIDGLLLFGSVARGEAIPLRSDIDVIVLSSKLPPEGYERTMFRRKFVRRKPKDVEVIWLTPEELGNMYENRAGVIYDALYEGIILYDEKGIIKKYMDKLRDAMRRGKLIKKKNYWFLPDAVVTGRKT